MSSPEGEPVSGIDQGQHIQTRLSQAVDSKQLFRIIGNPQKISRDILDFQHRMRHADPYPDQTMILGSISHVTIVNASNNNRIISRL